MPKLLVDNDFIHKIGILDLIEWLDQDCGGRANLTCLGSLRHSMRKRIAKHEDEVQARLNHYFGTLQEAEHEVDFAELQKWTKVIKIDPGEAYLLEVCVQHEEVLATGDKQCLTACKNADSLRGQYDALAGRVITFETYIKHCCSKYGFQPLMDKIKPHQGCDKALDNVSQRGTCASEENFLIGIDSYIASSMADSGHLIAEDPEVLFRRIRESN